MKKVIATVGTSLITNYLKPEIKMILGKEYDCIKNAFDKLETQDASQYRSVDSKVYIDYIEDVILHKWMKGIDWDMQVKYWNLDNNILLNTAASAEISSILKIKDTGVVYLIATDTILSCLAAKIIAFTLNGFKKEDGTILNVSFDPNVDVVTGLRVDNAQQFQDIGLPKLIEKLVDLGINNEEIMLNITGGYKGVIPYLTIIGQLFKNVYIMYLYEKSDKIIKIPKLPINFDWVVQEKFFSLCMIKNISNSEGSSQISKNEEIDADLSLLFEREPNKLTLSALGKILINTLSVDEIESRHVLGFLMEYRLVKHFNNYVYQDVLCNKYPIVETPNRNSIYNACELDLILRQEDLSCNKFVAIEVKSFLSKKKLERQVKDQIIGFNSNSLWPLEYHIVIYSFIKVNNDDLVDWFNKKIVPCFSAMKNCKPCLVYLYVDWNVNKKNESNDTQNPYKGYLSSDQKLNLEYLI